MIGSSFLSTCNCNSSFLCQNKNSNQCVCKRQTIFYFWGHLIILCILWLGRCLDYTRVVAWSAPQIISQGATRSPKIWLAGGMPYLHPPIMSKNLTSSSRKHSLFSVYIGSRYLNLATFFLYIKSAILRFSSMIFLNSRILFCLPTQNVHGVWKCREKMKILYLRYYFFFFEKSHTSVV